MSGIYIPGLSMPDDENDSIHILRDGTAVVYRKESIDFYKAIPVPDHGRLIDADAAIEDIRGEILEHQMDGMKGTPFYIEDLRTMWQRLEDEDLVPTIIPADKEGKG